MDKLISWVPEERRMKCTKCRSDVYAYHDQTVRYYFEVNSRGEIIEPCVNAAFGCPTFMKARCSVCHSEFAVDEDEAYVRLTLLGKPTENAPEKSGQVFSDDDNELEV